MLGIFIIGLALAASPGPDFFLILRNTINAGRVTGYATLLGNRLGFCMHILLSILGISAILQTTASLFIAIRLMGAAYLLYLGVGKLYSALSRSTMQKKGDSSSALGMGVAFKQGVINNILNPKVSIFFLSLFPQLASKEVLANAPWEVAGVLLIGNTCWWIFIVFALGSSKVKNIYDKMQKVLNILFGSIFVGYGLSILKEEIV